MLSYLDAAAISAAPTTAPLSDALRQLIADRVHDWAATELLELTYLVIMEAGDTEQMLLDAVGYSPLVNTLDGKRFDDPGFEPQFEIRHHNAECWELVQTIGNEGAAIVILIPDVERLERSFRTLLEEYAQ